MTMQLSYAQNLEDYHLELLFPDLADGTYVDVGGGHPVADNVSFHAYLRGWRGLIVEPQEDLARLYAGVRPRDRVETCLAGRAVGHLDFHVVDGMHGLSSALAANAERARGYGAQTRVVRKEVMPLSVLIDRAGLTAIHFLKIDVEGAEPDAIAGLDLTRHRPQVILVEAVNPNNLAADVSAWEPALLSGGYAFAFFDNLNRFYVANEVGHLAARLPQTPTAWDKVEHLWDSGRVLERPEHPDKRLATVLAAGLMSVLPRAAAQSPELLGLLVARGLTAIDKSGQTPELLAGLLGTAEQPAGTSDVVSIDALLASDAFRAALGRIACMYDGGHLLE
jgi:FkbM family methyltransferase